MAKSGNAVRGRPGRKVFCITGINPEPWTAPLFTRTGQAYSESQLRAYKEALASTFKMKYPEVEPTEDIYEITFLFWREMADYEIGDGRKSRRNRADATNLQKSTEDALQGILYHNDRDCQIIHSYIVEQGPDVRSAIVVVFDAWPTYPADLTMHLDLPAREIEATANPRKNIRPQGGVAF